MYFLISPSYKLVCPCDLCTHTSPSVKVLVYLVFILLIQYLSSAIQWIINYLHSLSKEKAFHASTLHIRTLKRSYFPSKAACHRGNTLRACACCVLATSLQYRYWGGRANACTVSPELHVHCLCVHKIWSIACFRPRRHMMMQNVLLTSTCAHVV